MAYENILLEMPDPGIHVLTLNRPRALNALNRATIGELEAAIAAIATDPDARVLLVTGAGGRAFVAGADIKEMQDYTAIEAQAFARRTMAVLRAIETLPVPVIAVVDGYALGGGNELAMSCDLILASERAVFGQPEVSLGITPGFGGTQRLTRLVGRARALELLLSGRHVEAAEALRIGLVNRVCPAATLMDEALALARSIAAQGPVAVRLTKEAVQRGQDLDLDNACQFEAQVFGLCFATADQKEGMQAFIDKRTARFLNR